MAKRHIWTDRETRYLESMYATWHNAFRNGKVRKEIALCPVDHRHAEKRGYCLVSERQWIISGFRNRFPALVNLSERAIWTKYGRVNGLRENGKVKRRKANQISDSYTSPSSKVTLVSGQGTRDSQHVWREWLETSGIPYISRGISRSVYDLGDGNVLKVQNATHRDGCNSQELNLWKEVVGTEYEKSFAPIVAADKGGRWLVMKKAYVSDDDSTQRAIVDDLRDVIREYGLTDIHYGNVGSYDGQPVIIDYAW